MRGSSERVDTAGGVVTCPTLVESWPTFYRRAGQLRDAAGSGGRISVTVLTHRRQQARFCEDSDEAQRRATAPTHRPDVPTEERGEIA